MPIVKIKKILEKKLEIEIPTLSSHYLLSNDDNEDHDTCVRGNGTSVVVPLSMMGCVQRCTQDTDNPWTSS